MLTCNRPRSISRLVVIKWNHVNKSPYTCAKLCGQGVNRASIWGIACNLDYCLIYPGLFSIKFCKDHALWDAIIQSIQSRFDLELILRDLAYCHHALIN